MAIGRAEDLREVGRLVDHRGERDFDTLTQFERGEQQNRVFDGVELGRRPAQVGVESGFQCIHVVGHAAQERLEILTIERTQTPGLGELEHQRAELGAGHAPLVERLHGTEAGRAAGLGLRILVHFNLVEIDSAEFYPRRGADARHRAVDCDGGRRARARAAQSVRLRPVACGGWD